MSKGKGAPNASGSRVQQRRDRRRRQTRAYLLASLVVAAIVTVTSFPLSSLLSQRHQLDATQSQLVNLKTENGQLSSEASSLKSSGSVAEIARADYGFVQPGQKAYEVLPLSSGSSGDLSGHVPLNGPVIDPDSVQSQAVLGSGVLAPSTAGGVNNAPANGAAGTQSPAPTVNDSWWQRTVKTLEFWK